MADIIKDKEIKIETIAMRKVLEGLIHNVNSHLNIILGYAQQLAKQNPEMIKLNTIYEAGLQIDNLMQSCANNLDQRIKSQQDELSLTSWLNDELLFLTNVLEVKHSVSFVVEIPSKEIIVETNPLLLGLYFESMILHVVRSWNTGAERRTATIALEKIGTTAQIILSLAERIIVKDEIDGYVKILQVELERLAEIENCNRFDMQWNYISDKELILTIPIKD